MNHPASLAGKPARQPPRSAALPVTFQDTVGLFIPADGQASSTAVLFLSPWGLEEMFVRKVWRRMAEALSDRGIASLRFDYAGTGDALDRADYAEGLQIWVDDAVAAARQLKSLSGCREIIIIAQGIGTIIATRAMSRIEGLSAIGFLAPVVSGRAYLRELQLWARLIDDGLGLSEEQRAREGVSVASLVMPPDIAAEIRKTSLAEPPALPVPRCLVALRADRPSDEAFAARLEADGASVARVDYAGYDAMLANPSVSRVPNGVIERIVAWVDACAGARTTSVAAAPPSGIAAPLDGPAFRETPLVFGENGSLYGILCEPSGPRRGATAILLGTAYDRQAGWGRMAVAMARRLAERDIASLRFDAANVGDSPPRPEAGEQVLYSPWQSLDVEAAVDLVESRKLGPAVVVGRCSGAYLAFKSTVADPRVRGAAVANPYVFEWNPNDDVDAALAFVPRSLDDYKERLLQKDTFRRLFGGQVNVRHALVNIAKAVGKRLGQKMRPLLHLLGRPGGMHGKIKASFDTLAGRDAPLLILYSENDVGYDHLVTHFGQSGAGLKRYPNVRLSVIEGADHNLTPEFARDRFIEAAFDVACDAVADGR